jgi:hypothetical protein
MAYTLAIGIGHPYVQGGVVSLKMKSAARGDARVSPTVVAPLAVIFSTTDREIISVLQTLRDDDGALLFNDMGDVAADFDLDEIFRGG